LYCVACANRIFAGPQGEAPTGGRRRGVKQGGAADVDSPGHGRFLLRDHLALQGIRRGQHGDGQRHRREARSVDRRRTPAIVVDASSCTLGIAHEIRPYLTPANLLKHDALNVLDSIAWAVTELLPNLAITRRIDSAVPHPTCSMRHLRR
jgi:D-lactate dehydrogenase